MDPKYNFVYRIAASLEEDLTEIDANWFDQLTDKAKEAYIRIHPQSKYARYYRRQVKQAPTDVQQISPNKDSLQQMKKHQKELDYAAKYEKDPARKKAFESEAKKMAQMRQRVKDRIDDEYYQGKEKRKAERKEAQEVRRAERKEQDPRKWWEKAIGRENPKVLPTPKKAEPRVSEEPAQEPEKPKPKYTPEQLQRLYRGGGMASDFVPDSAMPKPGHGPKPTNVVKNRKPTKQ